MQVYNNIFDEKLLDNVVDYSYNLLQQDKLEKNFWTNHSWERGIVLDSSVVLCTDTPTEYSNEIVKFIKLIFNKKIKSDVYNFSASRPIKFIKVLKIIIKIFKSRSNIIKKKTNKKSFLISNKKIKNNFNFKISNTEEIITRCCHNIASKNFVKSQNF